MTESNDYWIKKYTFVATYPFSWLRTASVLIHAANNALIKRTDGPLKGHYQNIGVYMMLSSFAIENIIKCVIINDSPSDMVKDGKLSDTISGRLGHDLPSLFRYADINCTASETDLLYRLTHFAIQAGRYPVPKNWNIFQKSLQGDVKHKSIFISEDLNTIVYIINKLLKELKTRGIDYDVFDISYTHTKDEKTTFVEERIHPHRFP